METISKQEILQILQKKYTQARFNVANTTHVPTKILHTGIKLTYQEIAEIVQKMPVYEIENIECEAVR
ncbi:MAG: hypothetical protein LBP62_03170 [Clostridiales bacterium]|jgi:hypothetical protein|nr:hypothetical protein [Clostridiales bacterium]